MASRSRPSSFPTEEVERAFRTPPSRSPKSFRSIPIAESLSWKENPADDDTVRERFEETPAIEPDETECAGVGGPNISWDGVGGAKLGTCAGVGGPNISWDGVGGAKLGPLAGVGGPNISYAGVGGAKEFPRAAGNDVRWGSDANELGVGGGS